MGKRCLLRINKKRRNADRELALVKAFLLFLFLNPKGFAHSLVF